MAFSLPSDLSTSWVDNSSTITAADWNNTGTLNNAIKSAIATFGYGAKTSTTAASESTASTTYVELTTSDQVTVAIGSSGKALVLFNSRMNNDTGYYSHITIEASGANTIPANDTNCIMQGAHTSNVNKQMGNALLLTNLTAGLTTFKLKYKISGGASTSTFTNRSITVIPLPSFDGTNAAAAMNVDASSAVALGMSGSGVNRPTFDAAATQKSNSATSLTWTHTATAGATVLVALTRGFAGTGASVTYDGNAMSLVGSAVQNNSPGDSGTTYLFAASSVAGGAKTVVASWSGSATAAACSVSYTGVAGLGQVTTGYGSSATPTLAVATTNIDGRILVCAESIRGGGSDTITGTSGGTQRALAQPTSKYYDTVVQDGVGSSVNFGVTPSATPARWAGVAVELMPSVPTYSKPTWVGTGGGVGHVGSTSSWTDTVPADANLAVLWVTSLPTTLSKRASATLGGTAMVEVTGSPWQFELSGNQLQCFVLQNPATGPGKTVQVTWTGEYNINANMVYYGGVTSVGTASPAKGLASTNPSMTVASQTNHLYAQAFCYKPFAAGNMAAYSANLRATWPNVSYDSPLAIGDAMGTGGTLAFTATRSDTAYMWAGAALDLSPAALPTPSTPTWVGTGAGGGHLVGPSISWVDTIPANANCAIVWLATDSDSLATATVTIGGSAATAMSGSPWAFRGSGCTIQGFYLLNPPTGANKTIAVSYSGNNWINASSVYYGGVSGVWNPTAATGAGATQPVMSVPNSQSNHLYCQAISYGGAAGGNTITAYDQTRRAEWACNYYDNPIWVGDAVGNDGTLAFNATRGNTSYEWGGVVVDLSPVAQRTASLNLAVTPAISMSAWKPVLFDAVGASGYNSSGTSFSWTHVIAADANAVLACCTIWCPGYGITVTATVGSTPMTQLSAISDWSSGVWHYQNQYTFGLLNPPTGTQTITVTIAGTDCMSVGNSVSYKNVEAFGTPVTSSETGTTATTTVASNIQQMVVVAFASALSDPPSTVGSYTSFNQTVRSNIAGGANYPPIIIGDAPGATSVTFTATKPNSSGGGIAVPVRAASGYGAFNLGVTPAISMVGTRNNYPAEVNLPFMSTIGMSGVGHSGS